MKSRKEYWETGPIDWLLETLTALPKKPWLITPLPEDSTPTSPLQEPDTHMGHTYVQTKHAYRLTLFIGNIRDVEE